MDKEKQRDALVEYVKSMQMQEQQKMQHQQQQHQTSDLTSNQTLQSNTSCFSNILVNTFFFIYLLTKIQLKFIYFFIQPRKQMIFNGNNQQNNGRFLSFNINYDRFQNAFIIFWFEFIRVNLEILVIEHFMTEDCFRESPKPPHVKKYVGVTS